MEKLLAFKEKIDLEIAQYFDRAIAETEAKDKEMASALRYIKKLTLAQGKRIRPALMFYGYLAAGGKDTKKILKTAVSIELIHIFLLIHDDIVDRGEKRHGIDTMHRWFEQTGKKLFPRKDSKHFGNSMALIMGDMIEVLGHQIIVRSGFEADRVVKALDKLQQIIFNTVIGQARDLNIEYQGQSSEREVLKMYEYKTAKYTFEGPLHLGAILGGGSDNLLRNLTAYAIPLGIAFQIQDDILGVFGSEKKMGKSSASDISEGKQTILVAKALENGNQKQKKRLLNILGQKNLTARGIKDFQNIIRETGSLDYAKKTAHQLIIKSEKALEASGIKGETQKFLLELANFMVKREI